ncbi:MAG: bifunctional methylenetetrahydrofolate dehydrogenase/methenyltetrahydrofolate cyclohydrolase FolD [Pseudomonadota bacterium]|nr:bifunctional methylenetetrahydrofolate dehydrogenase/methenyltetrahydrofolate cyclohydrolase FolD [Pseudomonadota bacterium]
MAIAIKIDGAAYSEKLRNKISEQVNELREVHNVVPGLAVILVGSDPASEIYVKNKQKMTVQAGMNSFEHRLPGDTSQKELLTLIDGLNSDFSVHGILVQLPLPAQIDEQAVIAEIDPAKDVDGFHVLNAGRLSKGEPSLVPCTPLGCLLLIKEYLGENISGKRAVVLGRSNIVGKPMAALLIGENCTVTIAHSKTHNLAEECARADILVSAVGKKKMVKKDWVKKGAVVIDVGINRVASGKDGKFVISGDIDYAEVRKVAAAVTPVPGGVGPMTIACLLQNTLTAACSQNSILISGK